MWICVWMWMWMWMWMRMWMWVWIWVWVWIWMGSVVKLSKKYLFTKFFLWGGVFLLSKLLSKIFFVLLSNLSSRKKNFYYVNYLPKK